MRKLLFATAILFAATNTTFAQDGEASFNEEQSSISVGYGFLSPYKTLFKLANQFNSGGGTTIKYSSTGPLGLTYEYGFSEKISGGIQIAYGSIKNVTTEKDGLGAGKDYIQTEKLDQVSVILRGNYHFGGSSKFDPYVGAGLGYGNFKYKISSNDPNDMPDDFNTFKIPTSFGITGQIGARYYFTESIGAYAELGYLAGSFAQIGITAKF